MITIKTEVTQENHGLTHSKQRVWHKPKWWEIGKTVGNIIMGAHGLTSKSRKVSDIPTPLLEIMMYHEGKERPFGFRILCDNKMDMKKGVQEFKKYDVHHWWWEPNLDKITQEFEFKLKNSGIKLPTGEYKNALLESIDGGYVVKN